MWKDHPTVTLRLPKHVQETTAEIDVSIRPLISRLWQLGFATKYCCQGDLDHDPSSAKLAYIMFRSRLEAAIFASIAGPPSWSFKMHRKRHAERPEGSERWTWDWWLDDATVRFPKRDIPRALEALKSHGMRLEALIGAHLQEPIPLLCAPPACPSCGVDLLRALPVPQVDRQPGQRICPACGRVVMARRKDARYCSRKCRLRNRDGRTRK